VLSGIAYAILLAFFALIGFEDPTNVVEEAKRRIATSHARWC